MRKIIYSVLIMITILFTFSICAYANSNTSYSNGTDIYSNEVAEFYINSDDEDKLYKLTLSDMIEEKVLEEHIISMVNKDKYLYLLVYTDGKSNLLKFDTSNNTYSLEKEFNSLVTNIAIRNDTLYYIEKRSIFAYNTETKETIGFVENEITYLLFFTDYNTLKYYTKIDEISEYSENSYSFDKTVFTETKAKENYGISLMSVSSYSPRLTAPSTSDPYYTTWNVFHTSGYGMVGNNGNCTCYAYGRSYENLGSKPNLSTGNAENWYNYNKNNGYYSYGKTPALGAVAVWGKGVIGNSSDGAGHVAVVEVINGDTVTTSESGWNSFYFKTYTRSASHSNFSYSSSYSFQGFIYVCGQPVIDTKPPTNPSISAIKTNGTQVTISWGAVSNATSYLCEIRKAENDFPLACNSVTTSQTSCVVDLTEGGTYYACVYAYNGDVSSGANWHIFGTPGRPKIKNVSTNGEYVTITWDATNYTTRYECKILKAEDGFPWACYPIETTETSCTVMLPEGGTYYALITALNSSGCSGADWYIFGTPDTPSVNSIVSNGDQVTIQWNTTAYTTYYRCTILKATDNFPMACDPIETTDTTCTFTLPEGGTYYAVVNSCNSNGNSGSEWTIFGTTGRPSINNISANGNKVSINWDATENTRDYTCNILKAEDGFPLACAPIETSDTTCTVILPEGKNYYAVVYAHNSIGSSGSDWRLFAVPKTPYTSSTVTKKGNNHSIKVVPVNIDSSCEVIIAGYKCGKFITLANVPYESKEINTTLTGDIDEIKVMVWNSLAGLVPMCDAEVIPSSEFIAE